MEALVLLLKNKKENTYHPIMYFEKQFPGQNENQTLIRYKSKGHRTIGFIDRQDAINSIKVELDSKLKELGYNINKELDLDLDWDGISIPADIQLRNKN